MDDRRFDEFTRGIAWGVSRRRLLSAMLPFGALALGWPPSRVFAWQDRGSIDKEETGPEDVPACPACTSHQRCIDGACCPEKQACDDVCCPPETIGCMAAAGPNDGLEKIACLCPDGLVYDRFTNACRACGGFGAACRAGDECCHGYCQDGACTCIGDGEACDVDACCIGACNRGVCSCVHAGGACSNDGDCCGDACVDGICRSCTAPGGTCNTDEECCGRKSHGGKGPIEEWGSCIDGVCRCCYSGSPVMQCGSANDEKTDPTFGLCCDYPMIGFGCCADSEDCSTCIAGCCTDGVDCDVARGTFPGCPERAGTIAVVPADPYACAT